MLTIRNPEGLRADLLPYVKKFEGECSAAGLEVLIHGTFRSNEEQARLFREGRSLTDIQQRARDLATTYGRQDLADILIGVGPQRGKIKRTNAAPGQSMHQYGLAFDGCPIYNGKLIYDGPEDRVPDEVEDRLWKLYGVCAMAAGLEWAGNWRRGREMPHCQIKNIDWRDLIRIKAP